MLTATAAVTALAGLTACAGTPAVPPSAESSRPPKPPATTPTAVPGATQPGTLPPVISRGPTTGKRIALTFDSNMTESMLAKMDQEPNLSYANDRIVDVLQKHNAPATFFLASKWVQRYPGLTKRIAADKRFELASHSYAHLGFTPTCYDLGAMRPADMAADVSKSFDILKPYGGRQTRYFRFPGGCWDPAAQRAIAPAGATIIQYSIVAADPFNDDPSSITANVLSQAKPGGIAVLHITKANAPKTDQALPAVITGLRDRGYTLVALSDLLKS